MEKKVFPWKSKFCRGKVSFAVADVGHRKFWTSSKFLSALESTTKNQEVRRSQFYRLQNVNNLPKDYIRMCLTSRSLAELFNFIGLQVSHDHRSFERNLSNCVQNCDDHGLLEDL